MPERSNITEPFRLGDWQVYPELNRIESGARQVALEPRIMDLLVYLASRSRAVVSRKALLDALWPDVEVNEATLTRAIYDLRTALGDDANEPVYIETIRKKGYRMLVTAEALEPAAPAVTALTQHKPPWGWMAVLVAALALLAWFSRRERDATVAPTSHPVTSLPGEEADPALAPHGDAVAFAYDEVLSDGDDHQLFVAPVAGGHPRAVTAFAKGKSDRNPAWSPDGKHIAFVRRTNIDNRPTCAILVTGLYGGDERQIASCYPLPRGLPPDVAWSPSGTHVVFSDRTRADGGFQVRQVALASGTVTTLFDAGLDDAPDVPLYNLSYAPDGSRLAFTITDRTQTSSALYVWDASARTASVASTRFSRIQGTAWLEDAVIVGGRRKARAGLWSVDPAGGDPTWMNRPDASHPTVAADGRLAYVRSSYEANVWSMTPPDDPDVRARSTMIDMDGDMDAQGRIVFVSNRSGRHSLWVTSVQDAPPSEIYPTAPGVLVYHPRWSPQGNLVVFEEREDTRFRIRLLDVATGHARLLLESDAPLHAPNWSLDGTSILFAREGTIQRLDLTTGTVHQAVAEGGRMAMEHPRTGALLVARTGAAAGIWRMGRGEEPDQRLVTPSDSNLFDLHWRDWDVTPDGIIFARFSGAGTAIMTYDIAQAHLETLGLVDKPMLPNSGLTVSEATILYTQVDRMESDIWYQDAR